MSLSEQDKDALVVTVVNALATECNKNAVNKGFWQDEDKLLDIMDSYALQNGDEEYVSIKQRIISLFNNEKIALEMSELAERLECLRKDPTKLDEHCPEFFNVEIEVADLIIRAMDFAGHRKLRLGEAILAKMKFNATRPRMHGKAF